MRFRSQKTALLKCALAALGAAALSQTALAQQNSAIAASIQKVIDRPEFKRSNFGIEFYDLATGAVIYSLNADKMFTPASTTKILTEGALLAKLGKDFRFRTGVYRTASIDHKGKLKGDLVVVASGDPNLSNRIQPDNTLAFHVAANRVCAFHQSHQNHYDGYASDFQRSGIRHQLGRLRERHSFRFPATRHRTANSFHRSALAHHFRSMGFARISRRRRHR